MTEPPPGEMPGREQALGQGRLQAASQERYSVRFGWGARGAEALSREASVVVVVDLISFSTTVSVAIERGCTVHPFPWDPEGAQRLAATLGGTAAVSRSLVSPERPYSLSPATLSGAPRGSVVVLPSPNGSAISAAAARAGALVVAGSLRNAHAVARFARRQGPVIAVIAAGERWADGSLDPALEDLLGAGAVVDGLRRRRRSPEAMAASAAYLRARRLGLRRALRECVSGREHRLRGYQDELEWASAQDVTELVPVLRDGAFRGER